MNYSTLCILIFGVFSSGVVSKKLSSEENRLLQYSCGRYVKGYNEKSNISETVNQNSSNAQFKLLYGNLANPGQAPWAVSITRKMTDNAGKVVEGHYAQHGTGTLISPYHIASAAHLIGVSEDPKPDCATGNMNKAVFLYKQTDFVIFVNVSCAVPGICKSLNRTDEFRPLNVSAIYVRKGYVGEGCVNRESFNDVAVFELSEPVYFSEKVYPVCIPEIPRVPKIGDAGAKLFGFGRDPSRPQNESMGILRTLDFDVSNCTFNSGDGLFCTSSRSMGLSCDGDSGSGVVQRPADNKAEHLIGVLSAGVSCDEVLKKHQSEKLAEKPLQKETDLLVDVSKHIDFFCTCCGICPLVKNGTSAN